MGVPIGVKLKVDRAVDHIQDLEAQIKVFLEDSPYSVNRETHPETGAYEFRLRIHKEIPLAWSTVIGDAVHNLRSGLDHLIGELVLANNARISSANEFPIFKSVEAYNAKAAGKVVGVSQQAAQLIDAAKPYQGGNDGLWQIHRLDVIDKHRTLITAYGSLTALTIDMLVGMRILKPDLPSDLAMPLSLRPAVRCPLEDGQILYRVAADQIGKVDDNPTFRIEVAFNEPGLLECEPLFPLLGDLADLVKRIVMTFDSLLP